MNTPPTSRLKLSQVARQSRQPIRTVQRWFAPWRATSTRDGYPVDIVRTVLAAHAVNLSDTSAMERATNDTPARESDAIAPLVATLLSEWRATRDIADRQADELRQMRQALDDMARQLALMATSATRPPALWWQFWRRLE